MTVLFAGIVLSIAASAAPLPQELIGRAVEVYSAALDELDADTRRTGFRRAKQLFATAIEQSGVDNAELYVDLGNAALLCEDHGTAILAYRRALALEPNHRRARQNLIYARQALPDWVPRPQRETMLDTFFAWQRFLAPRVRSLLAALCFAAALSLAAIAIRYHRAWARNLALLPLLAWLTLLGSGLWQSLSADADEAVVTVPETVARAADAAAAPSRFAQPLPAGTEVRIVERRDDWMRIELANGRDGWVRTSALTSVRRRP